MATKQPSPTPLRMPPELKEWIQASAKAQRRSLNAEIVTLLLMAKEQIEKSAMPH